MAVLLQHLLGDMSSDVLDRLTSGAALGEFGNQRVPVVVPASLRAGIGADLGPDCFE